MRKHVLCGQHLIDRSLIRTAARVKSQHFARCHLKGFNGFVNDDPYRKLFGLPSLKATKNDAEGSWRLRE